MAFIPHVGWLRHDVGEEVIHLLRQGHFEAAEQAFFWLYLRAGEIFIDGGAHVGLYSVLASKVTRGETKIISVEANAHTAEHLTFNLRSNDVDKAIVINAALWNSPGKIRILEGSPGEAAYDHVVFDRADIGRLVSAITIDELIERLENETVALVKLDIEGAEPEAILGGRTAIANGLLPVLMIEFTNQNLQRRGMDTAQLYRQLAALGYTLCEFATDQMQLTPFNIEGPIWYKNLFACLNLKEVNARLTLASEQNRLVARDVIARATACTQFKELEEMDTYKRLAGEIGEFRRWAEQSDAALVEAKDTARQMREWAEQAESLLKVERERVDEFRRWAEQSDAALVEERKTSGQLRDDLSSRKKLFFRLISPNTNHD